MAINSGKYRHRIKIYTNSGVRDVYGGLDNTRTLIANPWCKLRILADVEVVGTTTQGQTRIEFEIRYARSCVELTSDMFIVFKSIDYDIISVINPEELNEKLLITAIRR